MKIGNRIKELRTIYGITQVQLAEKAGISRSVISQYESNLVEPTATVVAKLALALNTSTDYLLGLEDDFGVKVESDEGLSANTQEKELLSLFRQLSPYLQGLTLDTVRGWAGGSGSAKSSLQKKA